MNDDLGSQSKEYRCTAQRRKFQSDRCFGSLKLRARQPMEWHTPSDRPHQYLCLRTGKPRERNVFNTQSEGRAAQRMAHQTHLFSTCTCLMAAQRMAHRTDLFSTCTCLMAAQRMAHRTDLFSTCTCLMAAQRMTHQTDLFSACVSGQGSPENDTPNRPLQYTLSEGSALVRFSRDGTSRCLANRLSVCISRRPGRLKHARTPPSRDRD